MRNIPKSNILANIQETQQIINIIREHNHEVPKCLLEWKEELLSILKSYEQKNLQQWPDNNRE